LSGAVILESQSCPRLEVADDAPRLCSLITIKPGLEPLDHLLRIADLPISRERRQTCLTRICAVVISREVDVKMLLVVRARTPFFSRILNRSDVFIIRREVKE